VNISDQSTRVFISEFIEHLTVKLVLLIILVFELFKSNSLHFNLCLTRSRSVLRVQHVHEYILVVREGVL
jgi:hypothetical protein